jgi:hypothetical protein
VVAATPTARSTTQTQTTRTRQSPPARPNSSSGGS